MNGIHEITIRRLYEDGVEVSSGAIETVVIQEAIPEIIMVGSQTPFTQVEITGRLVYLSGGNAWVMEGSTGSRRPISGVSSRCWLQGHRCWGPGWRSRPDGGTARTGRTSYPWQPTLGPSSGARMITLYPVFLLVAATTVLSPGPGVVMTLTNALRHGFRGTFGGILGISAGAFAVLVGLLEIVRASSRRGIALRLGLALLLAGLTWDRPRTTLAIGALLAVALVVQGADQRHHQRLGMRVALVWAADIGAYFAGRTFGRLKLAPRVSPSKTWEGVLGGLALSAAVAFFGAYWFGLDRTAFVSMCLAVVLLSIVGDLTESMFKRYAGLKDSGSIFPGHGGVLDRIDSVTAAAPAFLLGLRWLEGAT